MKSLSISLLNIQLRDAVEGSNFQPQFLQQGFSLFYQRSKSKIACRVQFGQQKNVLIISHGNCEMIYPFLPFLYFFGNTLKFKDPYLRTDAPWYSPRRGDKGVNLLYPTSGRTLPILKSPAERLRLEEAILPHTRCSTRLPLKPTAYSACSSHLSS